MKVMPKEYFLHFLFRILKYVNYLGINNAEVKPNLFTEIVSARQSNVSSRDTPSPNASPSKSLMCEAHIMMRKDEAPVVTLVLMHARVLLLFDWLTMANEFILLNTNFNPPRQFSI